jgi:predicted RNA-binding Zn ribbon-like protein
MPPKPWRFHLSGGRLCLDLANTVSWRASGRPIDRLERGEDLVRWARQARIITEREAVRLVAAVRDTPAQGRAALTQARVFREAIYRLFSALADDRAPAGSDLARINAELSEASRHLRVARRPDGTFDWAWEGVPLGLRRILWPVARSAALVLTSDDLGRLKKCPAADCGWIFLDATRNGTRRWCHMTVCGNRAKARRFYARNR